WQLILLGIVAMLEAIVVRPLRRLWVSEDPLDTYALVHLSSAAGDALVAIALAGSIFFDIPVDEAKVKVALYLASPWRRSRSPDPCWCRCSTGQAPGG